MGHLPGTEWLDAKGSISVSEEFPADFPPPPAGIANLLSPAFRSTSPLIFSILVHLAAFSVLAWSLHTPDRRPVKEVNYWVVSLVTAWKEEPARTEPPAIKAKALSPGPAPGQLPREAVPPIRRKILETEAASFQEFPKGVDPVRDQSAAVWEPLPPAPEMERAASPVRSIQANAAHQLHTGQALFRMRMGNETAGARLKYFYKNLREQATHLVQNSAGTNFTGMLSGGATSLDVFYRDDGEVEKISASPGFEGTAADFFQSPEWKKLPSPVKFGLPFKAVRLRISLDPAGQWNVGIAPF